jgi:hypothetical protein
MLRSMMPVHWTQVSKKMVYTGLLSKQNVSDEICDHARIEAIHAPELAGHLRNMVLAHHVRAIDYVVCLGRPMSCPIAELKHSGAVASCRLSNICERRL